MSRRAGLLTAGQREYLEREGYLLVPSLLDESVVAPIRARLDELVYQTLVAWDADPGQDAGERGVVDTDLGLSDPDFAPCREHPLLAEAAATMLGRVWHLAGLGLRAPLPGCGHQGLHPDYFPGQRTHRPWRSLSATWCISAFTPENGRCASSRVRTAATISSSPGRTVSRRPGVSCSRCSTSRQTSALTCADRGDPTTRRP